MKNKRILGRQLASQTTRKGLEDAHGGRAGIRTFTLRYPPDKD